MHDMRGWSLLVLAVAGCAGASRGFDRGSLRDRMRLGDRPGITDAEIAAALERRPQLPGHFRLAIYLQEPGNDGWRPQWQWTPEEKEQVLESITALAGEGVLGDAFVINPLTLQGKDLRAVRLAAAEHGADALMVVAGASDVHSYFNDWSATYWLILPLFFVPGNNQDAIFIARAAMWDVRNEYLYLTAEGESVRHGSSPAAFGDDRELVGAAKSESLHLLSDEITKRLRGMPHGATASRSPAR